MPERKYPIIVSGGSGGIGAAIIEKVALLNMQCYNLDIHDATELQAEFIRTDVAKIEEVDAAVGIFTQQYEKISALILCAGVGIHEKIAEGDPHKWKEVLDTNVLGTLNVIRAFIPFLKEGGNVIIISSVAATNYYEYGGIYSATKAALNAIAETLRLELAPKRKVTIIEPGLVESGFLKNTISGDRSKEKMPFTALPAQEIAETVVFILQRKASTSLNKVIIRPSDQKF